MCREAVVPSRGGSLEMVSGAEDILYLQGKAGYERKFGSACEAAIFERFA